MTNNKQLTKGNKMRKIAMIIGILSVMATSAQAGSWKPDNFGGFYYVPSYDYLMGGWY